MNNHCRTLSVSEVQPGSLLTESIPGADGQVEFPKGTAVTAAILEQLRASGVVSLSVMLAEEGSTREQAVAERLNHIFRHAGGNQASLELKRQLSTYRLTKNDD